MSCAGPFRHYPIQEGWYALPKVSYYQNKYAVSHSSTVAALRLSSLHQKEREA